jgi:CRISPR type III-B/RAMP module RAMP protein Cmr1
MSFVFEARFVTPLLIGGENPKGVDRLGLRGMSLRGCWRFWCRAMLGGILRDIDPNKLKRLENELFGGTDRASFRMQIANVSGTTNIKKFARLPHRKAETPPRDVAWRDGYDVGTSFRITITPRLGLNSLNDHARKALLGSIWLWGYLGAIGNRCRRGFGSPVLEAAANLDDPFSACKLDLKTTFTDRAQLRSFLREGVERVWGIFDEWLSAKGEHVREKDELLERHPSLPTFQFFTLRTLNQILINSHAPISALDCTEDHLSRDGAIASVHGFSCVEGELGAGGRHNRMASPAFIRYHKLSDGFLPVCTLSPPTYKVLTKVAYGQLHSCGFVSSLLEAES